MMFTPTDPRHLQALTGRRVASDDGLLAYCRREWRAEDPAAVVVRISHTRKVQRRRRLLHWVVDRWVTDIDWDLDEATGT